MYDRRNLAPMAARARPSRRWSKEDVLMPHPAERDRIASLEARIAELEERSARRALPRPPGRFRRLAMVGLALALIIPAGAVLAGSDFNDVPPSHQFYSAINAVADAGITTGCPQGTNNYCPNGLVTRGQMAAFMSRLGALRPGEEPKVNAAELDGLSSVAFGRAGIDVAANGNVGQWFNRAGGEPTVEVAGTGLYRITVPGKSFNVNNNFVGVVTLLGPGFATINSAGGTRIQVQTYDVNGNAADVAFHVIVFDASLSG
jgi:hypothetical protein